jgi:hypothetical protein
MIVVISMEQMRAGPPNRLKRDIKMTIFKGALYSVVIIGLFVLGFEGLASFALIVILGYVALKYIASELLKFATTDPLAWEERQRQRRHGGKALIDEVKLELRKASRMLKLGEKDKAMDCIISIEKKVHDYSGALNSTQAEEHRLISEFRVLNNLIKSCTETYGDDCAWCCIRSDPSVYECPACGFESSSTTSTRGLLKHWDNKHSHLEFPANKACEKHSQYRQSLNNDND